MNERTLVKISTGLDILAKLIQIFEEAQAAGETEIDVPMPVAAALAALDKSELELDLAIAKVEQVEADNGDGAIGD